MKKILFKNVSVFLLVFIFVLLTTSFFGQGRSVIKNNENEPKQIKKIIKISGWDIPTIDEKEPFITRQTKIDDQIVLIKDYKMRRGIYMKLDFYSLNEDDSLNTAYNDVELRAISSYSFNNKVFAYGLNAVPFTKSDKGVQNIIPVIYSLFYFDEDGDSKFETRYLGADPQIIIPDWVTRTDK